VAAPNASVRPYGAQPENTMSDFATLVSKALNDEEFRSALTADPAGTLSANGIEPTDEMVAAIQNLDSEAIRKLAHAFGTQQAAG